MENRPFQEEIKLLCRLDNSRDAQKLISQVTFVICIFCVYQIMIGVSYGLETGFPLIADAALPMMAVIVMNTFRSRTAAIIFALLSLVTVYGTLDNIVEQYQPGAYNILAALLMATASFEGIRGTFLYHKLKKQETEGNPPV
ncbi:MAG: hypothetical protein EPN97_14335 [Alphaproteobacteria bacterium]|nr:MAG: hypothetical protein EPN97_14335 [Alphaproteobacteria bacterium]